MKVELILLGGTEEIGANSCYVNLDGTGVLIDAGLHPRRHDRDMFPQSDFIRDKPLDAVILTHAHTDHIGGVPYILKQFPHVRVIATPPTVSLAEIMLRDTAKLLRLQQLEGLPPEVLELYDPELLARFSLLCQGVRFGEPMEIVGITGRHPVRMTFHSAGHILGAAGVMLECGGKAVFHTGDVSFHDQALIPGASFPRHHIDCLITECTNGAAENLTTLKNDRERLAKFINSVTNHNGSVLLPVFALGKTQELLKIVHDMMLERRIPTLPIYTGGMGRKISGTYDSYSYAVPRADPGFEVTKIPQNVLEYDKLLDGEYFSSPAIVLAPGGMMQVGTASYILAEKWMKMSTFGIGLIGYQDATAPGYALLNSERGIGFVFGAGKVVRECDLGHFRFTSHATRNSLLDFITDVKPNHLFLMHGEPEACEWVGYQTKERLDHTRVYIPTLGKGYLLE
jgi:Cft2 family RNA processing exonuclease